MNYEIMLRPITKEDTENIVRWRNSEHVLENFLDKTLITPESHICWLENFVNTNKAVQYIILANEIPIGTTFVKNIQTDPELGIFIGEKEYLGKGIGTMAEKLTIKEYFKNHDKFIIGRMLVDNIAANKAVQKLGFELVEMYRNEEGLEVNLYHHKGFE